MILNNTSQSLFFVLIYIKEYSFAWSDCNRNHTRRAELVYELQTRWRLFPSWRLGAGKMRYSPVETPWQRFLHVIWSRQHECVVRKGWFYRRRPPLTCTRTATCEAGAGGEAQTAYNTRVYVHRIHIQYTRRGHARFFLLQMSPSVCAATAPAAHAAKGGSETLPAGRHAEKDDGHWLNTFKCCE